MCRRSSFERVATTSKQIERTHVYDMLCKRCSTHRKIEWIEWLSFVGAKGKRQSVFTSLLCVCASMTMLMMMTMTMMPMNTRSSAGIENKLNTKTTRRREICQMCVEFSIGFSLFAVHFLSTVRSFLLQFLSNINMTKSASTKNIHFVNRKPKMPYTKWNERKFIIYAWNDRFRSFPSFCVSVRSAGDSHFNFRMGNVSFRFFLSRHPIHRLLLSSAEEKPLSIIVIIFSGELANDKSTASSNQIFIRNVFFSLLIVLNWHKVAVQFRPFSLEFGNKKMMFVNWLFKCFVSFKSEACNWLTALKVKIRDSPSFYWQVETMHKTQIEISKEKEEEKPERNLRQIREKLHKSEMEEIDFQLCEDKSMSVPSLSERVRWHDNNWKCCVSLLYVWKWTTKSRRGCWENGTWNETTSVVKWKARARIKRHKELNDEMWKKATVTTQRWRRDKNENEAIEKITTGKLFDALEAQKEFCLIYLIA